MGALTAEVTAVQIGLVPVGEGGFQLPQENPLASRLENVTRNGAPLQFTLLA